MGDSEIKEEIKEQNEPQKKDRKCCKEKRCFSEYESRIQTYRLAGQKHT